MKQSVRLLHWEVKKMSDADIIGLIGFDFNSLEALERMVQRVIPIAQMGCGDGAFSVVVRKIPFIADRITRVFAEAYLWVENYDLHYQDGKMIDVDGHRL